MHPIGASSSFFLVVIVVAKTLSVGKQLRRCVKPCLSVAWQLSCNHVTVVVQSHDSCHAIA